MIEKTKEEKRKRERIDADIVSTHVENLAE